MAKRLNRHRGRQNVAYLELYHIREPIHQIYETMLTWRTVQMDAWHIILSVCYF